MHSELSYGLSFAHKLQRVATIDLSGSHQPTPDPSFSQLYPPQKLVFPRPKNNNNNSPLKTVFLIQFFFENLFGVCCLCGENFVTPFSTLAMIKGSLPTNLTTPDRLRSWTKTESEDFPGFWVRTLSKKSFSKGPRSNPDLHPKRSP